MRCANCNRRIYEFSPNPLLVSGQLEVCSYHCRREYHRKLFALFVGGIPTQNGKEDQAFFARLDDPELRIPPRLELVEVT